MGTLLEAPDSELLKLFFSDIEDGRHKANHELISWAINMKVKWRKKFTLVNVYVDLLVFTCFAGTS